LEPICTYHEVLFERRCTYELRLDSIRIVGKVFLDSDFDYTVPFIHMVPEYQHLRQRSRSFRSGVWTASVGFIGYLFLVEQLQMSPLGFLPGFAGAMAITGLLFSLATCRKAEYAIFVSDAGTALVGIGHLGKDRDTFQSFVERMVDQVRKCRVQT
jgi:hypothetical protein